MDITMFASVVYIKMGMSQMPCGAQSIITASTSSFHDCRNSIIRMVINDKWATSTCLSSLGVSVQ